MQTCRSIFNNAHVYKIKTPGHPCLKEKKYLKLTQTDGECGKTQMCIKTLLE